MRFAGLSGNAAGIAGVALVGLALRVAAVVALDIPVDGPVTYEHGAIAENLLAGRGFSIEFLGVFGPTSQQAPLYPLALAALYWLWGVNSSAAHLTMQGLQCLAGASVGPLVYWLCRSLVPRNPAVAWTAAIVAAIYPPHVYMVTHLQVVTWATCALTLLLAVVAEPRLRGEPWIALAGGSLSGVLLLLDPILSLALPIVGWMWARGCWDRHGTSGGRGWAIAAVLPLSAALMISPWLVRNYCVHGEFVFVKTTFGYAFWQGNNPHSWGTDKIPKETVKQILAERQAGLADWNRALWDARHETLYIDDVLLKPHGYRQFQGLTEPERSRLLGRRATAFICERPDLYAGLCLQRLRYFLLFDETNPKATHPLYRGSTVMWLTLAAIGFLVSWSDSRKLWPTYAIFAVLTVFHCLTIVSARFRIPIETLSFVWIGYACGPLVARWLPSSLIDTNERTDSGESLLTRPWRRRRARDVRPSQRRAA